MTPGPQNMHPFFWGEIPQKSHSFASSLIPPKKWGNLMTPKETIEIVGNFIITKITHDPKSFGPWRPFSNCFFTPTDKHHLRCASPKKKLQ